MEELHGKCDDEKKLAKDKLQKEHSDKESESQLRINELVVDLRIEEEKLLETIDALNHSNEQGDVL